MNKKRILVDMSASLIHHGHIRLLKNAADLGYVVVGLTTDYEIFKKKGFQPELNFSQRKEILESIKYVNEVVEMPWELDNAILDKYGIDLLVHGDDFTFNIEKNRVKVFPRTSNISSSDIRQNAVRSTLQINNKKLMLTPGPASILYENLHSIKPLYVRGDNEYAIMSEAVLAWVKGLSGQDEIVMAQGSATFSLELAAHSFVQGRVLLVSTGYYSDRLKKILPQDCEITICRYEHIGNIKNKFDWVICVYTESSIAFKVDLPIVKEKANELGAKLFVDATCSIGLEDNHDLADVTAFSSSNGLFGFTGACFVAYKKNLPINSTNSFYFNLETHRNKIVTGPCHAIASLHGVIDRHDILKRRVIKSKKRVMEKWAKITRKDYQPLLCTYLESKLIPKEGGIVFYTPPSKLTGSVICHLGEIHIDEIKITEKLIAETS